MAAAFSPLHPGIALFKLKISRFLIPSSFSSCKQTDGEKRRKRGIEVEGYVIPRLMVY